ncbi:Mo-dependent nitrogenase C-terminal domain-containing protein [Chroococcus sp. FPU101]|uniref:Mo-dependent nitrogenase C-terminal domain-containing protein n=1 Tax=Chroococcus sp. FPU101 TaxID=1974212 RepID=UPI001A8E0B48|nr:Mo-dependent nitrogenase C-terminal domain-containing protein [Chroococcus sp. FPU101]
MKSSSVVNRINFFTSVRCWLELLEIDNLRLAWLICQIIPTHCPFERTIKLFNRTIISIPPLCKLNPFYDQLIELHFKALSYMTSHAVKENKI